MWKNAFDSGFQNGREIDEEENESLAELEARKYKKQIYGGVAWKELRFYVTQPVSIIGGRGGT